MGLLRSKQLAKEASSGSESTARNPRRSFGSWLSKKGQKTQPDSDTENPTQQEPCKDIPKAVVPKHHVPKDQEDMQWLSLRSISSIYINTSLISNFGVFCDSIEVGSETLDET